MAVPCSSGTYLRKKHKDVAKFFVSGGTAGTFGWLSYLGAGLGVLGAVIMIKGAIIVGGVVLVLGVVAIVVDMTTGISSGCQYGIKTAEGRKLREMYKGLKEMTRQSELSDFDDSTFHIKKEDYDKYGLKVIPDTKPGTEAKVWPQKDLGKWE